jgi:uncharacterized protein (DUF2147 family)
MRYRLCLFSGRPTKEKQDEDGKQQKRGYFTILTYYRIGRAISLSRCKTNHYTGMIYKDENGKAPQCCKTRTDANSLGRVLRILIMSGCVVQHISAMRNY